VPEEQFGGACVDTEDAADVLDVGRHEFLDSSLC
jgi:hypothetical protein